VIARRRGRDHIRTSRLRDLHDHGTGATGSTVHQHSFTPLYVGGLNQIAPSGDSNGRIGSHFGHCERRGLADDLARRNRQVLGVTAAAFALIDYAGNQIAACEPGDAGAKSDHFTGEVPARDRGKGQPACLLQFPRTYPERSAAAALTYRHERRWTVTGQDRCAECGEPSVHRDQPTSQCSSSCPKTAACPGSHGSCVSLLNFAISARMRSRTSRCAGSAARLRTSAGSLRRS